MPNNKKKRPVPVAPKPTVMKSRKKARQVTTLFHKYTRERDLALENNNTEQLAILETKIQEMGGRQEYQKASQLSTSFHSTSKWVIGKLKQNGWLYGIKLNNDKKKRRTTRLLEVGAINTQLLDVSEQEKYKLHVKAIDIHSMEKGRIEEQDFLTLPFLHSTAEERYDVIVCSMVLNCVTTPQDRGKMCALLYQHLRPGGMLFFTIPLFCLTKSAFLTPELFEELLTNQGVGFELLEKKQSPRVAFFICQRPIQQEQQKVKQKFTKQVIRRKGKKFPNQFCVVLKQEDFSEQSS